MIQIEEVRKIMNLPTNSSTARTMSEVMSFKMIYMGMAFEDAIFDAVSRFKKIQLCGVILDYSASESEIAAAKSFLAEKNIAEIAFDDIPAVSPDMIFLCNYNRIIDSNYLDKYLFVNIHAGILPKWRGFNANCWAMLNGENEIGYTLHRARSDFDGGEIYKIISVHLNSMESYSSGRDRTKAILCPQLEQIFLDILNGWLIPAAQNPEKVVYTCKLRKEDGDIMDWNRPAEYFINLYRVFNGGSGIRMFIKGSPYQIVDMERVFDIDFALGIPGGIINIYKDKSIIVKTADTAVKINLLCDVGGKTVMPGDFVRIGMRL